MKLNKAYSSHLPVLVEYMSKTSGHILELGAGLYSTPLFYWSGRDFTSYDNSKSWYGDMKQYHIKYIGSYDEVPVQETDLLFIDHAPASRRIVDIRRFKDKAKYIIIHDYRDPVYEYESIYPLFKYRKDYKDLNTTVLSNFYEL